MRMLSAVALAAGILAAGAAQAEIVTLTYSGTVASGIDQLGAFGAAGADLAGKTFSATAAFDDTIGLRVDGLSANGGSNFGQPDPTVSFTLEIGGAILANPPFSRQESYFADYSSRIAGDYRVSTDVFLQGAGNNILELAATEVLTSPISGPFVTITPNSPDFQLGFLNLQGGDNILFNIASATTDHLGPLDPVFVPEPAMWALMLLGFGGVGATIRRRRRVRA